MEALRHHYARLKNRVREIREVFISLRQLIKVTNRYPVFPQFELFSSERFMNEIAEKLEKSCNLWENGDSK